jgi:predicted nucleic acid-binding protein
MRTVVDASVVLKWYFPESGAAEAERILLEAADGTRELLAPEFIVAEVANTLWKKVRRQECDAEQAHTFLAAFSADAPTALATGALAPRALELAMQLDETVYDCLYVAAAIENGASLVTADAKLARCARSVIAEVELIA